MGDSGDLGNFSMLDLFRTEVSEQCKVLSEGLLAVEADLSPSAIEPLMRAAHSVKGAARLIGVEPVVRIAHVMEDAFIAAQAGEIGLDAEKIDILLKGVDSIVSISTLSEEELGELSPDEDWIKGLVESIKAIKSATSRQEKNPADLQKKKKTQVFTPQEPPPIDASMLELFRAEVAENGKALTEALLKLEKEPGAPEAMEPLMRAAHSIKGAARLVGVEPIVKLAHVIEDVFVAAMNSELKLTPDSVDVLLAGVDAITSVGSLEAEVMARWGTDHLDELGSLLECLEAVKKGAGSGLKPPPVVKKTAPEKTRAPEVKKPEAKENGDGEDRVLRVTAERWNHLMGLAGEVKVEIGRLFPQVSTLGRLKKQQTELVEILDTLRGVIDEYPVDESIYSLLLSARTKAAECRKALSEKASALDSYERKVNNLSECLHRETISARMRPFSDGVQGFPRMVRDISRSLGKNIKLDINGLATQVDRDVLEKIEAPLNHILRNGIDHGVELPEERVKAGKPEQAAIKITAAHARGMLSITIEDDGRGIDVERIRQKVMDKALVPLEMASNLNEKELLDFLFLPNFSTRDNVTEISGRGVGLDVVLDTMQKLHGSVTVKTQIGRGTRFHLEVPITLSVISALIVEIAGEPYAFPLSKINRAVKVPAKEIMVLEDHQFITMDSQNIGIVGASNVLGLGPQSVSGDELSLITLGNNGQSYGIVVDRFIGQKELAIRPLDTRLGKIKDISSASVLEDGSPVLVMDVDDLVLSVEGQIKGGSIAKVRRATGEGAEEVKKRVLVVDDSLTVREVERNLLEAAGYHVDVAVDGMDGWNTIRMNRNYNLIISDVDMPRMDGLELIRLVKSDKSFSSIPVIIISYKEREEDRRRGLEAGADYYLTKGSFHDNTFIEAVTDLIGEA